MRTAHGSKSVPLVVKIVLAPQLVYAIGQHAASARGRTFRSKLEREDLLNPADNESVAETAWVNAIRDGNQEAWRELIDRYEGRLLAYAQRRLGDREAS